MGLKNSQYKLNLLRNVMKDLELDKYCEQDNEHLTMALGSTQPLTKMSTRNVPGR
jgi:hypothetical protein